MRCSEQECNSSFAKIWERYHRVMVREKTTDDEKLMERNKGMSKAKMPRAPREQHTTERQRLLEALGEEPLGARELSRLTSMSEKDVYAHLPHVEKTLALQGQCLLVHPAECMKCGFVLERNGRFHRPGRCPECRHERIAPPTYAVEEKGEP